MDVIERINIRHEKFVVHGFMGFQFCIAGKVWLCMAAGAWGRSIGSEWIIVTYDLQRPAPIKLTLPCRTHLLMVPQPPKAVPSAGEQVLKIWVCWRHVTFKSYSMGHFPTSQVVRYVAGPDMGTTQTRFQVASTTSRPSGKERCNCPALPLPTQVGQPIWQPMRVSAVVTHTAWMNVASAA